MLRIRRVEEAIADAYPAKEMKCPIHLSIGQEAVPVGLCAHLTDADHVYSTHRCHAHYLAKRGDLAAMMAELHGKATGCCRGKGGSMHLGWPKTGMMGASALVGGTIPLAVGSALAFAREKSSRVSVAFFGDGASEEGIFYESLNFAQLKKLPVIFACENNLFATYSRQEARQATTNIASRGETFGMHCEQVDGYDVEKVYEVSERAVARARRGEGPSLLEFMTYRWRDHVGPLGDLEIGYRTKEEVEAWEKRCSILSLETKLTAEGALTEAEKNDLEAAIYEEIQASVAFARRSPFPAKEEIFEHIYADN